MPTSEGKYSLRPNLRLYLGLGAVLIGILAGAFRLVVLQRNDPFLCDSLMQQGSWLDGAFRNWQPEGCMLHAYTPSDLDACLSARPWVFIGDSVTRKLYFQTAHTMDSSLPSAVSDTNLKHSDHKLKTRHGTDVMFFWDPFLNSTHALEYAGTQSAVSASKDAAVVVLGTGLWFLRYSTTAGGLSAWKARVENVLDSVARADHAQRGPKDIYILPVEDVVPSKLSPDRSSTMLPSDIDAMNSDLSHRISLARQRTGARVFIPQVFNAMLHPSQTDDGLHFSDAVVKAQANLLLNGHCNKFRPHRPPFEPTCCRQYSLPPWPQELAILGIIVPGLIFWARSSPSNHPSYLPPQCVPLVTFGVATWLVYTADRTGLWLKEQKQFDPWTFTLLCFCALGVGLATLKRSDKDLGFMSRQQTDEWKGWMQIVILIYHYTGASKISGIYNPIRTLVAAYLFMTGYGHTFFYLKKADFSFLRVAQVLVRLNLLTLILAYTMDHDILFYYFAPLVSMWYLILYGTMAIGSSLNERTIFVLGKIFVSAAIVATFLSQPWMLETTFDIFSRLFAIQWSAKEWAFRVKLDLWMVYSGMVAAIVTIKVKELRLMDHAWWPAAYRGSIVLSGLALVYYFVFELGQESKFTYNAWHPYIGVLPVVAFSVLRNATPALRAVSSSAFAFIGTCSLETFIIQSHLWLAGDTRGVLLMIPGTKWRPLNLVLTTVVFIFVSDRVARATAELTTWICGSKDKQTLPIVAISSSRRSLPPAGVTPGEIPLVEQQPLTGKDAEPGAAPGPTGVSSPATPIPWAARFGLKSKLVVGMLIMWALNLVWKS